MSTPLEAVADAIDAARYAHPEHPRERPMPFADAHPTDREYALRMARAATGWLSMDTAPKDGSWIIGLCHDRVTMIRVSWGRDRKGELYWCSTESSYGEGMFCGWKPFGSAPAGDR